VTVTNEGIKLKTLQRAEQNTLILRDTPSDTAPELVVKIFSEVDGCPTPVSVRSDVADTWFIAFASEVDARSALTRSSKDCRFNDKPVRCRLKTESLAKAFAR
jgi:hypothetical protein